MRKLIMWFRTRSGASGARNETSLGRQRQLDVQRRQEHYRAVTRIDANGKDTGGAQQKAP